MIHFPPTNKNAFATSQGLQKSHSWQKPGVALVIRMALLLSQSLYFLSLPSSLPHQCCLGSAYIQTNLLPCLSLAGTVVPPLWWPGSSLASNSSALDPHGISEAVWVMINRVWSGPRFPKLKSLLYYFSAVQYWEC